MWCRVVRVSGHVLVLVVYVSLQVALEVRLVVADGAVEVGWLATRHFLVET